MPAFLDLPVNFRRHSKSEWVASLPSRDGTLEIVLHCTGDIPDARQLERLKPFFQHTSEIVRQAKQKLRFATLYRLVRVSVFDDAMYLQFKNRITRTEKAVFSYEHSA